MALQNNFSVGKDVSLDVVTPTGVLNLPVTTTGFEARPVYTDIRVKCLDGINRGAEIPEGWNGTISLDRSTGLIDSFFAQQEAAYYAGQTALSATITQTIQEANGSVSQYRFVGVAIKYEEAGMWASDKTVPQKIGFFASQRLAV